MVNVCKCLYVSYLRTDSPCFSLSSSFLFLCSFPFCKGRPHAIIHIGPHKAASTHIQLELYSLHKQMANVDYNWPTQKNGIPVGIKDIANFALALKGKLEDETLELTTMSSFFQDSLARNKSIVLSSEEFDDMNKTQVSVLRDHLKGFNVTIVFVYRDFLAQLISLHFESNRFEHSFVQFSQSFSTFLFGLLGELQTSLNPIKILNIYAEVFGVENLRIIDLLGTAAAGVALMHVLLCEIGGILCEHIKKTPSIHGSMRPTNSAYSLLPAQVFSFYKSYTDRQSNGTCAFCGPVYEEYQYFAARYLDHTKAHSPPAIATTRLTLLVAYAQQADAELRATYGSVILHGNQTANFHAMAKARVEEINPEVFVSDVYWNHYIESEYQIALTAGRLCHCGL